MTKELIERLRSAGAEGDAIHCWNMCVKAADAIESLQAENERLKADAEGRKVWNEAASEHMRAIRAERDALAAKLDGQLDELRTVMCGVGVVGKISGYDVIIRESVIDLIDRRRNAAKGGQHEDA